MLARKNHDDKPLLLPKEWCTNLSKLLTQTYANELEQKDSEFYIYGETYPSELILTIGIHSKSNTHLAPTTLVYSVDLDGKTKPEKILDNLVDGSGLFLDTFFNTVEWEDYVPNWTKETFRSLDFHYKITRENMELFLKAEALLNQ